MNKEKTVNKSTEDKLPLGEYAKRYVLHTPKESCKDLIVHIPEVRKLFSVLDYAMLTAIGDKTEARETVDKIKDFLYGVMNDHINLRAIKGEQYDFNKPIRWNDQVDKYSGEKGYFEYTGKKEEVKRSEVTLKIMATPDEVVEVIRAIKKCFPQIDSEPSESNKRLNECYAQTDCEASDQFDDSAAQDIVLNQMGEAMKRGADPFPMMSNEGIEALRDVTSDFLRIVIPVQDLIQVRDVANDVHKASKHSDDEVISREYRKVCYVPKEIQMVAARELQPRECKIERTLFLVDFLLSHFYPDNKRIKIKLADGYTPQVFVISEYDESNEGYPAELRVRDKNEKGKYEAIRGFVKPDKAINFKLFC